MISAHLIQLRFHETWNEFPGNGETVDLESTAKNLFVYQLFIYRCDKGNFFLLSPFLKKNRNNLDKRTVIGTTTIFRIDDFSFLERGRERGRERDRKKSKKSDVPDFSFLETNRSTSRNRDGLVSLSPMVIRLIERKRSQRNVNGEGAPLPRRIVIRANFPASVLGSIGGAILSDERQRHLFFSSRAMFDFSPSFEPFEPVSLLQKSAAAFSIWKSTIR